jgi:predicted flap endonuclease-1-like 5' DNA nuclease
MADINVIYVVLLFSAAGLGAWMGWLWRSRRATVEKSLLNVQWHDQLETQRRQNQQLAEQNKTLMEQNSHYRASTRDASSRATELADALEEAVERRDRLQRQVEDIRSNLEAVVNERDQLQSNHNKPADSADESALKERDDRIARLTRELQNWQSRLPPLIERFRARDAEARGLESKLIKAAERIRSLESALSANEPRADRVDRASPSGAIDADNGSSVRQSGETLANEAPTDNRPSNDGEAGDVRDDLKLIKGVGPAIERTLNEMGVVRFEQIAAMTELEIDRIADRLKGFRSRVYREDWIGQARELQLQAAADH